MQFERSSKIRTLLVGSAASFVLPLIGARGCTVSAECFIELVNSRIMILGQPKSSSSIQGYSDVAYYAMISRIHSMLDAGIVLQIIQSK